MFTLLKAWQDLWISIPISSSCLVTKLCQTICNPTDCSTPGFAVLHHLPVCSNSCPLSLWCHPTISSSVTPFFSCLQSFPASGSFLMSWLFASGGRNIGASASTSVLPMNIQGWFSLGLTDLISLLSKTLRSLLQHHSSKASILWCLAFFMVQLSYPYMTTGKTIALTVWTFVSKVCLCFLIYCLGVS